MGISHRKFVFLLFIFALLWFMTVGCQTAKKQLPTEKQKKTSPPEVVPTKTKPPSTATSLPTESSSGSFEMVSSLDEIVTGKFKTLTSTEDGTVWLVTDRAVARIVEESLTIYLPEYDGDFAGVSAGGLIWVVSKDGTQISSWNGQEWNIYGENKGWTPLKQDYFHFVKGGQSDLQKRIWFATSQDVRMLDGEKWRVYSPSDMGMVQPEYEDLIPGFNMTILQGGRVWVTECDWGGPGPFGGRGIRWLENGTWRGAASLVASGCATALSEDGSGHVWTGVDKNLWRYDTISDAWTKSDPPESPLTDMRFGFIESLAVDSAGTVWAVFDLCGGASCYGYSALYTFYDGEWTLVGKPAQYDSYWGPIFEVSGSGWFAWEGGIYNVEEGRIELISDLKSRSGVLGRNGWLWFVAPVNGQDTLWVLKK